MESIRDLVDNLDWSEKGQTDALMAISRIIGRWQANRQLDTE